jgi:hypothetical protein
MLNHSLRQNAVLYCTGLKWTVEDGEDVLRLIIGGTADQMSVVKEWFVTD